MQTTDWVLAAGALGTTCFGIVEALKWTFVGVAGFGQIKRLLGTTLTEALALAYGPSWEELLKAQYREDAQGQGAVGKSLRQGVRIGLNADNAKAIAAELGTVDGAALLDAIQAAEKGEDGDEATKAKRRAAIGRFEVAADARISSALSKAQDVYLGTLRMTAGGLAIVIAQLAGTALGPDIDFLRRLLLGVAAVPLAPIANDVVGALQAATKALKAK